MIDWSIFANWVVTGFLGVIFGAASAWVTYRYQRKQDDIKWTREVKQRETDWLREQEKLKQQWEHDKALMLLQSKQRFIELEQQYFEQEKSRIKDELLRGLENPVQTIKELEDFRRQFSDDIRFGFIMRGIGPNTKIICPQCGISVSGYYCPNCGIKGVDKTVLANIEELHALFLLGFMTQDDYEAKKQKIIEDL